ncbi:TIGR00266 family protein [Lacrimispora sp. 210928-DFI.3.58]|uniref:TIGR00266 family protein n=1 Tax=Lacrimispora sp. 210928-DFI.3.58 TaxID=2883214 RepID=UPI0015B74109|nr:TIGR00266 family protein [Lacrimispora sp. 210928-DFI.3.58]MCB7317918.1 TIGR00266 family protein [Lacrimispora sp. 210928-DFI.3.58]
MDYRILGETLPAVEVRLQPGEAMYTQSGGMAWMSDGFHLDSNVKGGLMKGLGRMFAGESLFMATYTAERPDSIIAFASTVPGKIMTVDVSKTSLICQKGAFLCAQPTVEISTVLTKKISAGFFGGEGFILQKIQGSGMAFLEVDGDLVEKELAPGESIKVDTGNVFAFEPSVSYEIEMVKGVKNIFFGGEGLFLTKLTGPGKIYMQTMNIAEFTGRIAQGIPSSK